MTRRLAIVTFSCLAASATCFAGTASATPPNKTTITVTCDRDTEQAIAHVELLDGSGTVAAVTDLTCGQTTGTRSERQVISTLVPVTDVAIGPYEITTATGMTPCAGSGSLTFKLACTDASGGGAALVVR
jgi:hypothetical protein